MSSKKHFLSFGIGSKKMNKSYNGSLLLKNKLCVNELSIETSGTKKYIKKDWRKARKSYVPYTLAPDTSLRISTPSSTFIRNGTNVFQAILYSHFLPLIPHSFDL